MAQIQPPGEILFLAHRIPFPPNRGDKIRSHHILRRLAQIAPVHVACFADDAADCAAEAELAAVARSYCLVRRAKPLWWAAAEALASGKPVSLTAFHHAQIAHYVDRLLARGSIGTIYVFSGQMGHYVPAGWPGRVIMDFVDVDSAKFEAYAARGGAAGWAHAREGRLLRAEEARLAARVDTSLLISQAEADLFTSRLPADTHLPAQPARADVRVLGNGIDAQHFAPAACPPEPRLAGLPGPRLIFTGQMDYGPNIAAAERVAAAILPRIRQVLPEASFHIIGRNPTRAVRALATRPGVHVWGRVADMRPWLRAADLALVPLNIARGVQNKVLEAMAMALPVVLTSGAASGIDAVAGQHFVVADRDEDLATAALTLLQDGARAQAMGLAARRFVAERQSWQSALAPLDAMVLRPPKEHRDAA